MSTIKNVAIAGASGSLGSHVFEKLVASGQFNIRVLKRIGSPSTFPAGTDFIEVDYSSVESLRKALDGQDAVVSTLATEAVGLQRPLLEAAIASGVKRILPSEFGSNLDNPKTRKLPVFIGKVAHQDYLIENTKGTDSTYTFVYNGNFLDWGLQHNFILDNSKFQPALYDGGETVFSTTSLSSVGDAVVGVLSHPEETKNRAVYISDIFINQKRILELAQEVAPNKPWAPVTVKLDDVTAKSDARFAQGLYDMETFVPYLLRANMDPSHEPKFEKNDNELLGVKGQTEEYIKGLFKSLLL